MKFDERTARACRSVAVARIPELHNTALYFERAARAAGYEVETLNRIDSEITQRPFEMILVVDPLLEGIKFLPDAVSPTAAILIDVHQELQTRAIFARFCDHVFVAQRDFVPQVAMNEHPSVHWLPLAGDPDVHFVNGLARDIDVGFVGKLGYPGTERRQILSHVLNRFATNDTSAMQTPWEMGRTYSRSKIVFNKSIGGDVNMRVFEALASGALLVTDRIGNGLNDLLTEGEHYVGYDSAEEAVSQIERYLQHDAERERIARAGQRLLNERHTYECRFKEVARTVRENASYTAPARNASSHQLRLWRAEWARRRGISARAAAGLLREGLAPAGYGDLAIGMARAAKRAMREFVRSRQ